MKALTPNRANADSSRLQSAVRLVAVMSLLVCLDTAALQCGTSVHDYRRYKYINIRANEAFHQQYMCEELTRSIVCFREAVIREYFLLPAAPQSCRAEIAEFNFDTEQLNKEREDETRSPIMMN